VEIPRKQRYLNRPLLTDLFAPEPLPSKDERNRLIHNANVEFGYSLKEISDALGLHYTTISKILSSDF
jgi:hypothetical protein